MVSFFYLPISVNLSTAKAKSGQVPKRQWYSGFIRSYYKRQLPYQCAHSRRFFRLKAFNSVVLSKRCGISAALCFLAECCGRMHTPSIADETIRQLVKSPVWSGDFTRYSLFLKLKPAVYYPVTPCIYGASSPIPFWHIHCTIVVKHRNINQI